MQINDYVTVNTLADTSVIKQMFGIGLQPGDKGLIVADCGGTGREGDPKRWVVQFKNNFAVMFQWELDPTFERRINDPSRYKQSLIDLVENS